MSEVFEAVFIGDLHLDKMKKLFPKEHLMLQFSEIKKAYEYASRNGIKNVFLMGDVAEAPRLSYEALIYLMKFLRKIKNIHTFVILGNHDFSEMGMHSLEPFVAMSELKMLSNVTFFDQPYVEKSFPVPVNFSPYPHTVSISNAINLGHFEISGAIGDNGRVIRKAVDINESHLWIMGHLHTPHDISKAHYVGTLYQTSFGESLPKFFTHGKFKVSNGKLKSKLTRIPNDPQFKLFNLPVENKHDLKKIEKNPHYLYKLFIKSDYDLHEDLFAKYTNIVDIKGYSNKNELKQLIEEEFVELNTQDIRLPSVTDNLKSMLKNKGASRHQVKRASRIVNDILFREK